MSLKRMPNLPQRRSCGLAMTDFTELSYQSWISVIIITLVIILVLAIERGIRKKLKEEKE